MYSGIDAPNNNIGSQLSNQNRGACSVLCARQPTCVGIVINLSDNSCRLKTAITTRTDAGNALVHTIGLDAICKEKILDLTKDPSVYVHNVELPVSAFCITKYSASDAPGNDVYVVRINMLSTGNAVLLA